VADTVTLTITTCRCCPHVKEGPSYSLDGWDRGNDWTCQLTAKNVADFVERQSEVIPIPKWCPLRKKKG